MEVTDSVEVSDDKESSDLFFGPISHDKYPPYAREKIKAKFSDPNSTQSEARRTMWQNFRNLKQAFNLLQVDQDSLVAIYDFIKSLGDFPRRQLEQKPEGGLGRHLEEITNFSRQFFLDESGSSRFPDIIADHHAQLLADVIAPLHDALKFLGSPSAQIMPDHEVITAEFVRENWLGRKVILQGRPYALTFDDVDFIAAVIEDHENIEKEAGRSNFIHSSDPKERAKALFFVADVLTGVLVPDDFHHGSFKVDKGQLKSRFTDLYFRHIDLVKGKIFRPKWGVYTIKDLVTIFGKLASSGLNISTDSEGRSVETILVEAALLTIKEANEADRDRNEGPKFNLGERQAIVRAESELDKLRQDYLKK